MFTKLLPALALVGFSFLNIADARNDKLKFPISDALEIGYKQNKLYKDIEMHFGTQKKFKVETNFGNFQANKKANAVGKKDRVACNRAFLNAMISLQDRARKEGGNAVINIKSYYYKHEIDSAEIFECGAGTIMAGVTFTGDVVKLKK